MTRHPRSKPAPPAASAGQPASQSVDWLLIGEVIGVFGLQGEVKVRPETDFPERFTHTPVLYLGPDHTPMPVAQVRVAPGGHVVLRLDAITDATSAGKLRGKRLYVPASDAVALPPDSYYLHDLIGLRAQRPDGTPLGTVTDIYTGSGNDVYAIRPVSAGPAVLVPAVKEMVKRIDLAAGIIVIDPVPGLFDDNAEIAD